ncbi:hypothetical protein [Sharpea azabuensis]|uniref:hypothetical protein n=1 Tax=Sharpea azabuensis TaxID=322505 RepID=UPI00115FFDD6|nr:hypothetical protein [Sharpea azabuensis]
MILASDFDNTLYFRGHFKKDDLKAIKAFQEAGGKFGSVRVDHYLGLWHQHWVKSNMISIFVIVVERFMIRIEMC